MAKLFILITLVLSSTAFAKKVENYGYPYKNPYLATLTYELVQNRIDEVVKTVRIPGLTSRDHIPMLEGRNFTRVNVYRQKKPSPLMIMVTGTGSDCKDTGVNSQAEILYDLGYSVVVLPSPFHWTFVLSENPTGTPGYTPDESKNLYSYMQKVVTLLEAQEPLHVTNYYLSGYSLGGAEAAFISEIDRVEKIFDFKKILLVNPPFQIYHAINTLDKLLYVAAAWTPQKIDYVTSLIYSYGDKLVSRNYQDPKYFYGLDQTPFSHTDYDKFLIGAAFRSSLGDVIFVNQQIKDTGLLKLPAAVGRMSDRMEEAHTISFAEFTEKLVLQSLNQNRRAQISKEKLFESGSLMSIKSQLINNPRVFIFHNADDFLVRPEFLAEFDEMMGERMMIFPAGGHMGNIWYKDNRAAFRALFEGIEKN